MVIDCGPSLTPFSVAEYAVAGAASRAVRQKASARPQHLDSETWEAFIALAPSRDKLGTHEKAHPRRADGDGRPLRRRAVMASEDRASWTRSPAFMHEDETVSR